MNACTACAGDGFVTVTRTVHGHTYSQLLACPACSMGASRRPMLQHAVQDNDEELLRLVPQPDPSKIVPPPPRKEPVL